MSNIITQIKFAEKKVRSKTLIFLTALKRVIYLIEQGKISLMDVFSQFDKLHAKLPTSCQFPYLKSAVRPKVSMKN